MGVATAAGGRGLGCRWEGFGASGVYMMQLFS